MSEKHNEKTATPRRKAQYTRPRLVRYGAVADLTLGSGGTITDGSGTRPRSGTKGGN